MLVPDAYDLAPQLVQASVVDDHHIGQLAARVKYQPAS